MFSSSLAWTRYWTNTRVYGNLRRFTAHHSENLTAHGCLTETKQQNSLRSLPSHYFRCFSSILGHIQWMDTYLVLVLRLLGRLKKDEIKINWAVQTKILALYRYNIELSWLPSDYLWSWLAFVIMIKHVMMMNRSSKQYIMFHQTVRLI